MAPFPTEPFDCDPCDPGDVGGPAGLAFAAIGDLQGDPRGLRLLLDAALPARPAFGVLLGDSFRPAGRAPRQRLVDLLRCARLPCPLRAVPGASDAAAPVAEFVELWGPRTWWFHAAGTLVVGVDDASGPLTPESLGTIARSGKAVDRIVVLAHRPFHDSDADPRDAALLSRRLADLRRAFCGSRIDAIVAGHSASWSATTDDEGTLHVTVGRRDAHPRSAFPPAAIVRVGREGVAAEPLGAVAVVAARPTAAGRPAPTW